MSERSEPRVVAGVGVILRYNGGYEPCMSRNLSRRGMFALAKKPMAAESVLDVDIIHENVKLSTKARVASSTEEGMGLVFIDPSDEFNAGIARLISRLLGTLEDEAAAGKNSVFVGWSPRPDGKLWDFWTARQRTAILSNLSVDGASMISPSIPEVGEHVMIHIKSPYGEEKNQCEAEVVRHTKSGFAVRFISPTRPFRALIGELRKSML